MMRLDWTPSGYRFVDIYDERPAPNKSAKQPEVEMVGGPPPTTEYHHAHEMNTIPLSLLLMIFMAAGFFMGYSL